MGGTRKPRVKVAPQPTKHPPKSEISTYVRVVGWRASLSLSLESGTAVSRKARADLEVHCELPEGWKPRPLVIWVEGGRMPGYVEVDSLGVLLGSKQTYSLHLYLTNDELAHFRSALLAAKGMQLSIRGTKPKYRHAEVYNFYFEAASQAELLSPPEDI